MKVLYATAECWPFAKTGGLGDVSYALPKSLKKEGIDVRVINMPTIKPIDRELIIDSAKKTGAIITAEEHSTIGGLGSAVSEVVTEEYPVIVKKIGVTDVFGQSGTPSELISAYGLTSDNIIKKVKEAIEYKS